jgi:hypothetical protein
MKRLIAMTAAAALLAGTAFAQPYQPQQGHGPPPPPHGGPPPREQPHGPPPPAYRGPPPREVHDWHKGEHYDGRGEAVDWHREHLREPPQGYEWVDTGGQYVLVAIASGVIADILIHAAQ